MHTFSLWSMDAWAKNGAREHALRRRNEAYLEWLENVQAAPLLLEQEPKGSNSREDQCLQDFLTWSDKSNQGICLMRVRRLSTRLSLEQPTRRLTWLERIRS